MTPASRLLASAVLLALLAGCATTGGTGTSPAQVNPTVTANLAGIGACGAYAQKHHDAPAILARLDEADAALAKGVGYDDLKALLFRSVTNPQDQLYFAAGLALVEPSIVDRKAVLVLGAQNTLIIRALMDGCRSAAMIAGTQKAGGGEVDPAGAQANGGTLDYPNLTWTACKTAKDCKAPPPLLWPGSRF